MALVTGWIAVVLIVLAGTIPLAQRLRTGKRAAPTSPPIRAHVALGIATSGAAFVHTASIATDLGSPGAVSGGMATFGPGALAFFVLLAHTGIGFQLRNERLKDRVQKRNRHRITAALIVLAATVHVVVLRR